MNVTNQEDDDDIARLTIRENEKEKNEKELTSLIAPLSSSSVSSSSSSSSLLLLRVSDFCRTSSSSSSLFCRRHLRTSRVRVTIQVASSSQQQQQQHQHQQSCSMMHDDDPDAMAWCSSLELFRKCSISSGSIVWLCRERRQRGGGGGGGHSPEQQDERRRVPIVLHLIPDKKVKRPLLPTTMTTTTTSNISSKNDVVMDNDNDNENDKDGADVPLSLPPQDDDDDDANYEDKKLGAATTTTNHTVGNQRQPTPSTTSSWRHPMDVIWVSPLVATCLGSDDDEIGCWNSLLDILQDDHVIDNHDIHDNDIGDDCPPASSVFHWNDECWVETAEDGEWTHDRLLFPSSPLQPLPALEISLRPLLCHPSPPLLPLLQPYNIQCPSPPPPPGRLITRYGVVSSYHQTNTDSGQDVLFYYQVTRIVGDEDNHHPTTRASKTATPRTLLWVTTPRTRVVWDTTTWNTTTRQQSLATMVPRLPPLTLARAYYYHYFHPACYEKSPPIRPLPQQRQQEPQQRPRLPLRLPPHPDVKRLYHVLNNASNNNNNMSRFNHTLGGVGGGNYYHQPPATLHVIGTRQEHNVHVALQVVADLLGRHYVGVFGLAAFAYAHATAVAAAAATTTTSRPDVTITIPHTVTTGGWTDKLAGLQAALDMSVQSYLPSLLHLGDVDTELVDGAQDAELRQDQEARIVHLLQTHFSKLQGSLAADWEEQDRGHQLPVQNATSSSSPCSYSATVPLLLVLSTQRPLPPGPLLRYLTSSVSSSYATSLQLSLPDATYARYLWKNHAEWRKDVSFMMTNHPTAMIDDEYLVGRPVFEIVSLRDRLACYMSSSQQHGNKDNEASGTNNDDDDDDDDSYKRRVLQFVTEACQELDRVKRNASAARIPNVSWNDVGGLAVVRQEIMDAIELPLQHPDWFPDGRGRTGILLYGAPGTGKTLIAKAVATECGLPFLSVKGPELLGSYVGESEANVRATFLAAQQAALENKPHAAAVLFFDELDSLAPRRGGVGDGGGVMDRVVATLLVELDRTTASSKNVRVFCMGATNRPDLLDPSLLRPGRLDRLVYLGLAASDDERAQILSAQLRKVRLDPPDVTLIAYEVVKELPTNLTNADLASVVRQAVAISIRRLCQKADDELEKRRTVGGETELELDQILLEWGLEGLEPVVTVTDLLEASKTVVPSVTDEELTNYERLGDAFGTQQ